MLGRTPTRGRIRDGTSGGDECSEHVDLARLLFGRGVGSDKAWNHAAMTTIVAVFMLVMAVGMAGMWTVDILRSAEIDRSRGLLRARDRNGSVMVPHWLAEYSTAVMLLVGGLGLLLGWPSGAWAWFVPAALGALAYTGLNSQAWVLADHSRAAYGIPIAVGFVGAVVAFVLILAGVVPVPVE